jgi:hypothetical protein
MRSSLSLALRLPTPAIASAVALAAAVAAAHANADLDAFGITAIVGASLCVIYLVCTTAYTYWRIASGWDVRPVRKEYPWSWRCDPESGQLVPLEHALSTSTLFHTIQSLQDLHASIYDMIRGVQHEHVCSSDFRKPGPAHKPAPVVVVVVAAPAEETNLTELLHSSALFFSERQPVKIGQLAVPDIDYKGRVQCSKPQLGLEQVPRLAPFSRSAHNETPPTLPLFTCTLTGARRTSLPSFRRERSDKENALLISRL